MIFLTRVRFLWVSAKVGGWEAFLAAELRKLGFVQGLSSPCCFHHREKQLRCVVHGDDFTFAGPAAALVFRHAQAVLDEGRRPAGTAPKRQTPY